MKSPLILVRQARSVNRIHGIQEWAVGLEAVVDRALVAKGDFSIRTPVCAAKHIAGLRSGTLPAHCQGKNPIAALVFCGDQTVLPPTEKSTC